ncbi:Glutamate--tRNA ligase [Candidatus Arcanobacter lacustris]|jgi:glutamyl-tRNA synthetase|uniref:Glutamate--tRNA ligase n=1 Tax=Candidatus Arcanibacter lacustris TaxID=1607817 RepID=A0A0F5MPV4_9RICK|nr:Glutamate--tRNA ligase [Candidatus Arcanobacter lacustris]
MTVITRFAPSPTGYLHIGSARTALFNYLFSKHHGGKFLLRIEDTDRARSTDEAVNAIITGLDWLGIKHDDEITYQFARGKRHAEFAHELVKNGKAYYCYMSQEELLANRSQRETKGFRSIYRDTSLQSAPKDIKPVIRLKSPLTGETVIEDLIQGKVRFNNEQADDMVLLRSDGTATYMLAVVVDDHDMGITHIIRGDDHLNNASRQTHLYQAMSWEVPKFAHIPLIHGDDGAKLSKRHGALGVEAYQEMGYLPEALCNYLLRLGWSHGNDEIISQEKAIEWFDLKSVGKSPSRLDFKKLANVNQHYIKNCDDQKLLELMIPFFAQEIDENSKTRIIKALRILKPRATNLVDIAKNSLIFLKDFTVSNSDEAREVLAKIDLSIVDKLIPTLESQENWQEQELQELVKKYCQDHELKLGDIAQILRIYLTGSLISPSVFDIMSIIGKNESMNRIKIN